MDHGEGQVQHRQGLRFQAEAPVGQQDDPVPLPGGQDAGALFQQGRDVPVFLDPPRGIPGVKGMVPGDVDGEDGIFIPVEPGKGLESGDDAHLMLHAAAPEEQTNGDFHNDTSCLAPSLRELSAKLTEGVSAPNQRLL